MDFAAWIEPGALWRASAEISENQPQNLPDFMRARPQAAYLTPAELAKRLQRHKRTLANWRSAGKGPPWKTFGQSVYYPTDTLLDWEARQPLHGHQS